MATSGGRPLYLTPFNETLTTERTSVFTLSANFQLSDLRNVVTGSPSHTGEEYLLQAGDRLESADIGNYIPGYTAEAGIGIRVPVLPTGDQVMRWGYYDTQDGFGWELDSDGLSTFVRRGGTDTLTAQSLWNVGGVPGSVVDLARGTIFQILFSYYGYGQIVWEVADTDIAAPQDIVRLHRFAPSEQTSVRNPNLPITAEVVGAGDGELYVAGRQFSIVGRYSPKRRTSSIARSLTGIGTTWTPVIAFRRQDNNNAARVRTLVEGITIKGTADLQMAVVLNPTLTFGTAVPPDLATTAQTAIEFSVNPSGFSIGDGQAIVTDLVPASGTGSNRSGSNRWDGLNIPVARRQPAVLVVRALTGTVDVDALLRSLEEW